MTDAVTVLAERLRVRYLKWRETRQADIPQALLDDLAAETLAVVVERLPTREEITDQIAGMLIPYLVAPEPATGTTQALASFIARAQADALVALLRERLGVKS